MSHGVVSWPHVSVDLSTGTLRRAGVPDRVLAARERAVLAYLFTRAGQIVDRSELHREVWGASPQVVSRAADNVVVRLRAHLERDPARPELLLTVHGGGYRLLHPSAEPHAPTAGPPDVFVHGARTVDLRRGTVDGPSGRSALTARELEVLVALRDADGAVIERDTLHRRIWGGTSGRGLEHTVSRLRKKIEEDPSHPTLLITTALGYRLDLEVPPLQTVVAAPLPVPRSRTVGRTELVDQVFAALRAGHRLVTLTGIGGMGKSRVALAVGGLWPIPPWWFGLDDAEIGLPVLARALGLTPDVADPATAVARAMGALTSGTAVGSLVVLDGARSDDVGWVGRLLEAPRVSALVTARAPLGLQGEVVIAVPPLPETAAESLFLAVLPRALAPEELAIVPELLLHLGGVPLALELAAARARATPLEVLVRGLREGQQRVLQGAGHDRPVRHFSMDAALRSSLEPLSPEARTALRRLTAFVGPAPVTIVERALAEPGVWVHEWLQELADAGLASLTADGRWRVPSVVRDVVAREGGRSDAERRHFLAWAPTIRELRPDLEGDTWRRWGDALPDLAVAIRHALAAGETSAAVAAASAWWQIVDRLGPWLEGPSVLAPVAAAAEAPPDVVDSCCSLAEAQLRTGRAAEALEAAERAFTAARRSRDDAGEGRARLVRARAATALEDQARAEEDVTWMLTRPEPLAGIWLVAAILGRRRQIDEAQAALRQGLVAAGRARDHRAVAQIHAELGSTFLETASTAEAGHHLDAALRVAERAGDVWIVGLARGYLAFLQKQRDPVAGLAVQRELAAWFGQRGASSHQATCLVGVANTLLNQGDLDSASDTLEVLALVASSNRHRSELARLQANLALQRGRPDEAIAMARRAYDQAITRRDGGSELGTGTQLADLLRRAGRWSEARTLALELRDRARAYGSLLREVIALLVLGEAALGLGDRDEARQWFEEVVATGEGFPVQHAHAVAALRTLG